MKNNLAKITVEMIVKPARLGWLGSHGPVNRSEGLVVGTIQSGEVVEVWIAHGTKLFHPNSKVSRVLTNAATTPLRAHQ